MPTKLKPKHHPNCDVNDRGPDGIKKPCNCAKRCTCWDEPGTLNCPVCSNIEAPRALPWRRYRFRANLEDSRPVKFPPPGPWWESGFGDSYSVVIAYLPSKSKLTDYWPEASEVEYTDESEITFTDRFARPEWWKG